MHDSARPAARQRLRVGDLDVDLHWQTVHRDGEALELPELSFRLLVALARHAPHRVTKDELVNEVWDGVVVSDETLAQRIRLLRQALGEDSRAPRYIAAVRGQGYRLLCPVKDGSAERPRQRAIRIWAGICAVLAIMLIVTWYFAPYRNPGVSPTESTAIAIAVLPFSDLSANQENRHFADGLQEELLSQLTRVRNLEVLSRTSVERFRSTEIALPEIAAELGADAIIEGSVRIADSRIRITVQLIDGKTDRHVWADNFERELSVASLFDVQEEVASQVAQALQLEYRAEAESGPVVLPTTNLDAYEAYLLGRHHTFRLTPQDLELAVDHLQNAIAIDAEFAEAYAALGWTYSFLGTYYGNMPPGEVYPKAKEAALRALALDGELADARGLYADILTWYDWDFESAKREYLRAIEIEQFNVLGYALFLSIHRRHDEAIRLVEQRIAFDPTDTDTHINAACRYLNAGKIEQAIAAARLGEGHPDANVVLAYAFLAAGDTAQAIDIFETDITERGRGPAQIANLAFAYAKAHQTEAANVLLEELESIAKDAYVSPALFAAIYFASGDADSGFAAMQVAVAERAREVIFLQVNLALAGFRNDPRYDALIREIGFNAAD